MVISDADVAPHFRLYEERALHSRLVPQTVSVTTERQDGTTKQYTFIQRNGYLESLETIPEPHEFIARLRIGHGSHTHDYDVEYVESGHHAHVIPGYAGLDVAAPGYQDPHELAHANDIRHRFTSGNASTGQILMFGLTGGLIPCPAAISVLLMCLQLKKVTLGATLVLGFSIGLALTLVLSGVVAAVSVRHASKHWSGFGEISRRAPYLSGVLLTAVGLYVGFHGLRALT